MRCLSKKPHSIFQCDDSKVDPQLNVLKAIRTAVGGVCIANCFSKVGFLLSLNPGNGFNAEDDMPQSSLVPLSASSAHDSDEDIPLAELAQRLTPTGKTHYYRPHDS